MDLPKFSVITVSYNHAEFIRTTIDSVLAQEYPNFEHIIVDGGSTDETLEILRSYNHLKWTSEPDRGISHALNKGIERATGDVIAWINSDDWYERGTFLEVAKHVQKNPVVLGNAVETDRQGVPRQAFKNHPRTYYDLLKYWVPLAWLAQPAVFFTKEAIESVRLPSGEYIDETFHYAMDYDLWLRLSEKFPLTCHIDQVFAYFRMYGTNKTGRVFASPQRELGRSFRSSTVRRAREERRASFVLPITSFDERLTGTLGKILEQDTQDFDVILVNTDGDSAIKKHAKDTVEHLEDCSSTIGFRLIQAPGGTFWDALKMGIMAARSSVIVCLQAGDMIQSHFLAETLSLLAHDAYGGCVYSPYNSVINEVTHAGTSLLNGRELWSLSSRFFPFAFRGALVPEIVKQIPASSLFLQSFFMMAMVKGWMIPVAQTEQLLTPEQETQEEKALRKMQEPYLKAHLILLGAHAVEDDIFFPIRAQSPYTVQFSEHEVSSSKALLELVPDDWSRFSSRSSSEELTLLTKEFPYFALAWFLLSNTQRRSDSDRNESNPTL